MMVLMFSFFPMFFGIYVLIQHNMFITFSNLFVHENVNKKFPNLVFLTFQCFCTFFNLFLHTFWRLFWTLLISFNHFCILFSIFYIFKFCTLFVKCQQCKNLLKPFLFTTRYWRSDGRHLSSFIVFTLNGISFGSVQ